MKKLFLFLSISFSLHAQTDSLKVTFSEEKVEKFEKTTLIDEYEKAFGGNRVVKSGLRVKISDPGMHSFQHAGLQYEQKIGKSISVIATIGNVFQIAGPTTFESDVEARWYFSMKKKVALVSQKPNITGNYIGLKVQYYHTPLNKYDMNFKYLRDNNQLFSGYPSELFLEDGYASLNLGKQFGNALNFSFMIGLKRGNELKTYIFFEPQNLDKINHKLFFTTQNQIGLGLLLPKKTIQKANFCDFLKCNLNLKNLWKLNINNGFYLDKSSQNLKLDLSYEQKIAKSPFSINSNLVVGVNNLKVPYYNDYKDTLIVSPNGESFQYKLPIYSGKDYNQPILNFGLKEQIRYYAGMKERIRKGKQGNNLNGIYTGFEYFININKITYKNEPIGAMLNKIQIRSLSALLGYQTLASNNSFLDINLAIGVEGFKRYPTSTFSNDWLGQGHFELSIKLGLAK
ncbi:hypothetical protein EGI22_20030 [Lacihabitans sp. LS3-19]|uniref:hypothetical protein n=1 Tax=Lacihabitans sp. LS3-19 TaxID=2487335 RepID=UPI0020CC1D77|nr:hypothetical protein [Lacihabitans sp. LS3-19]MCP9770200.1 hypothetical protein [Lacihabitans sp. LS3-19]